MSCFPAEDLLSGIDDFQVIQDAQRRHGRANIHQRDRLAEPFARHILGEQPEGSLQRERFHVDDLGGQSAELGRGHANVHVLRS